jgi:hypothetical protein
MWKGRFSFYKPHLFFFIVLIILYLAKRIIKHTTSAFRSENTIDKLRIQIYELNGATAIGKKDIPLYSIVSRDNHIAAVMSKMKSQLNSAESPDETTTSKYSMSSFSYGNNLNDMMTHLDKHHSQAQLSPSQSSHLKKLKLNQKSPSSSTLLNAQSTESVNYLVILIGVVCLGILFLPLTGTSDSYLPTYMYVTHEIKLISTFILGLFTFNLLFTPQCWHDPLRFRQYSRIFRLKSAWKLCDDLLLKSNPGFENLKLFKTF